MKKIPLPILVILTIATHSVCAQNHLPSPPASTSDWQFLMYDANRAAIYVDAPRTMPDSTRRMWVKTLPMPSVPTDQKVLTSDVALWEFDRQQERMRLISGTEYYSDGSNWTSDAVPSDWAYIIPGTYGSRLISAAFPPIAADWGYGKSKSIRQKKER